MSCFCSVLVGEWGWGDCGKVMGVDRWVLFYWWVNFEWFGCWCVFFI